ncbi:hypothetical protein [Thalassomonas sp. RHCl1]|uniref:hypothetical protein n=1 Tax=Thalassomonas sp. RHCl1 TaxID=2995320 RepID=UPI00248B0D1B|nr:hypothetical protein [Thalassomonas sp. RHCl1]
MSQKLAAKDLKQVTGGSGIDTGMKPNGKTLRPADLKMVSGGSGIHKGDDPKAQALAVGVLKDVTGGSGTHKGDDPKAISFTAPVADIQAVFSSSFVKEEDIEKP